MVQAGQSPPSRNAAAVYLGRRAYGPMHSLQEQLVRSRTQQEIGDLILLLEHERVITKGRSAKDQNLLASEAELRAAGVELFATGRGGDVTFHGPGQLVGYPILDLRPDRCDLRKYVRQLAELMILIARCHHVEAGVIADHIGVWVDQDNPSEWAGLEWAGNLTKVGAIGVRVSRWVTMHGFALNLTTDLADFEWIVPCGIKEYSVASLASLGARVSSVREVALALAPTLQRALDYSVSPVVDLSGTPDNQLAARLAELAPLDPASLAEVRA